MHDESSDNSSVLDAVKQLHFEAMIDGPADGIARRAVEEGDDSLSQAQIDLAGRAVYVATRGWHCGICGEKISPHDVGAYLDSGYCSWHHQTMTKDD
jgi:hypothetical protein